MERIHTWWMPVCRDYKTMIGSPHTESISIPTLHLSLGLMLNSVCLYVISSPHCSLTLFPFLTFIQRDSSKHILSSPPLIWSPLPAHITILGPLTIKPMVSWSMILLVLLVSRFLLWFNHPPQSFMIRSPLLPFHLNDNLWSREWCDLCLFSNLWVIGHQWILTLHIWLCLSVAHRHRTQLDMSCVTLALFIFWNEDIYSSTLRKLL